MFKIIKTKPPDYFPTWREFFWNLLLLRVDPYFMPKYPRKFYKFLKSVRHYIKYRAFRKWVVVKTDLKNNGWYVDGGEKILQASFKVLSDFVKHEFDTVKWFRDGPDDEHGDEYHEKAGYEILYLYSWWTQIRPNRSDPWDDWNTKKDIPPTNKPFNEIVSENSGRLDAIEAIKSKWGDREYHIEPLELERCYEEEDTEMLIRLMKIRQFLWT